MNFTPTGETQFGGQCFKTLAQTNSNYTWSIKYKLWFIYIDSIISYHYFGFKKKEDNIK